LLQKASFEVYNTNISRFSMTCNMPLCLDQF